MTLCSIHDLLFVTLQLVKHILILRDVVHFCVHSVIMGFKQMSAETRGMKVCLYNILTRSKLLKPWVKPWGNSLLVENILVVLS